MAKKDEKKPKRQKRKVVKSSRDTPNGGHIKLKTVTSRNGKKRKTKTDVTKYTKSGGYAALSSKTKTTPRVKKSSSRRSATANAYDNEWYGSSHKTRETKNKLKHKSTKESATTNSAKKYKVNKKTGSTKAKKR
ncbi:MAG: hypothetical protein DRI46_13810 [Chloroflexi bacterium]|nr:MAG: hypothetical protein DRI46_13810 [Chloroflexota bacterium]